MPLMSKIGQFAYRSLQLFSLIVFMFSFLSIPTDAALALDSEEIPAHDSAPSTTYEMPEYSIDFEHSVNPGGASFYKHGKKHHKNHVNVHPSPNQNQSQIGIIGNVADGQRQIAQAIASGRGLNFVIANNLRVVRLLPDDTQGRQHQKWIVALDNGQEFMAVFNTDICDRVPLKVGDVITMGGQYIYERDGGLLHWLHDDPKQNRPNGFVEVNGQRFGKVTRPNR